MFKVNNNVFIGDLEHVSHFVLVFLLLTLKMQLPAGNLLKNFLSLLKNQQIARD